MTANASQEQRRERGALIEELRRDLEAFEAREPGDAFMRNWLLDGLRLSNRGGRRALAAVVAATRAFLPQPCPVSRFIAERCEIDIAAAADPAGSAFYEFSAKLYAAFLEWRGQVRVGAITLTAFGRRLSALGFPVSRRGNGCLKARIGIRLKVTAGEA